MAIRRPVKDLRVAMGKETYTLEAKDLLEIIAYHAMRPACEARFVRLEKWFVAFLFVMVAGAMSSITVLIVLLIGKQ